MGTEEISKDVDISYWQSKLGYDQWMALPVSGPRPSARYKHAAAVAGEKLYIAGGSRNGRYLSDVQAFDFRTLEWSNLELKPNAYNPHNSDSQEILPPISGHNMIKWGNKLLLLGGQSKKSSVEVTVWYIDLETHICGIIETSGKIPIARGGQSTSLVGSKLIMFGGEDRIRRLLNDVNILDLETRTWDVLETTQTSPAPRFDHTATVHAERYLLIFGGCSHANFFNDLYVLDLQSLEWSQPQILGDLTNPRAGHAGAVVDENWYIVGGGDNRNGCPETLVLDMYKLVWSVLTSVKPRDPLASEGVSVCMVLIGGYQHLVTFGGYNGKYSNEIFVLRPKTMGLSRPKILQSPAAAAAAASVSAAYALSKTERSDSAFAALNSNGVLNSPSKKDITIEIEAIKHEKSVLEASLARLTAENSVLKREAEETSTTHADLEKEFQSVQGQLVAERSRCFNLEAQIAELNQILESIQSIEEEVQALRRQKSISEQDMESDLAPQRQSSGGVWKWIGSGKA